MIRFEMTGEFDRAYRELVAQNPQLRHLIYQRILWFCQNPKDSRIKNHPLKRRLKGIWAFSITHDIRIIYSFTGKKSVRFLTIGTHATVYRKH